MITEIPVIKYQTADDKLFDTREDAERHEAVLRLAEFLEDHGLLEGASTKLAAKLLEVYYLIPKKQQTHSGAKLPLLVNSFRRKVNMNFFQRRKEKRRQALRVSGYNYAAGVLLRREQTVESLGQYGIFDWGHFHNDFERGMIDAIVRLDELGVVKSPL